MKHSVNISVDACCISGPCSHLTNINDTKSCSASTSLFMLKLLAVSFFLVFKLNYMSLSFASPRGKSRATISSSHLWLISLSNKSCVGLDVYERQEKKGNPSSNEFMLSGFTISIKFALMCAWEHFRINLKFLRRGGRDAVGNPVEGEGG